MSRGGGISFRSQQDLRQRHKQVKTYTFIAKRGPSLQGGTLCI